MHCTLSNSSCMHKHMKTNVSHVFKQHGMEHVMCHRLWKTISKLSKTTIECTMFTERVMIWERAWATHWTSKSNTTAWCVQICGESNAKMGKKTNTGMFFPRVGSQNQSEIPFLSHIFPPTSRAQICSPPCNWTPWAWPKHLRNLGVSKGRPLVGIWNTHF